MKRYWGIIPAKDIVRNKQRDLCKTYQSLFIAFLKMAAQVFLAGINFLFNIKLSREKDNQSVL